jgi:tetrapyrrole methylase family protein/MazG family protein
MKKKAARKKKNGKARFSELVRIMARLRGPNGCPWDKEQTHESLLKYLREETEETVHAVRSGDYDNLAEELGDVLLQILFHSQIAAEAGRFGIDDVLTILRDKLVRRHPHVFSNKKKEKISADEVVRRWKKIKKAEKARK